MVNVTYTPAVVETKVVELAPAKFVMELDANEISMLHALLGRASAFGPTQHIYTRVSDAMHKAGIEKTYSVTISANGPIVVSKRG